VHRAFPDMLGRPVPAAAGRQREGTPAA
jgi:hypothetical protein